MNSRLELMLLILGMTTVPAAAARSEDAPELANNPFSRPPSAAIFISSDGSGVTIDGPIVLTATMVSTSERLAQVDNRVLSPGDDYQGYRLLRVFEDRAVFERDEETVTVYVKPTLDEDDEQDSNVRRRR